MAAIKYSINFTRVMFLNLKNTDANYAFNSLNLEIGTNKIEKVRGFIGVRNSTSSSLEGAFCWGSGATLQSFVFEVVISHNAVAFHFPEMPSSFTVVKAEKILKKLIMAAEPQVQARYIKRSLPKGPKKRNGTYTGARLEAWGRKVTLPKNKFSTVVPDKFTRNFAALAPSLNITYK